MASVSRGVLWSMWPSVKPNMSHLWTVVHRTNKMALNCKWLLSGSADVIKTANGTKQPHSITGSPRDQMLMFNWSTIHRQCANLEWLNYGLLLRVKSRAGDLSHPLFGAWGPSLSLCRLHHIIKYYIKHLTENILPTSLLYLSCNQVSADGWPFVTESNGMHWRLKFVCKEHWFIIAYSSS